MDKKEYIIRQLSRTTNKKYEAYVVSRIVHLLNDVDIKFVTQQYVNRPEGRALTDLYFPQVNMHIEVDEPHHKFTIEYDKIREADIVNATNHKILRVDVSNSIDNINSQVDAIIDNIRIEIKKLKVRNSFFPWDVKMESDPETYIQRGYIDISDNVAFRTIRDACNCFGHNYAGYQQAGARHPNDPNIMLWFPKFLPNEQWDNQISDDEVTIIERNTGEKENLDNINRVLSKIDWKAAHKRIVFAKVRDNLGVTLYRFRGLYELNIEDSNARKALVWQRKLARVTTYPPN